MSYFLQAIGSIIFASQSAYADGASTACQLVDGCTPTNTAALFLPPVASLLIGVVAALSIMFVVWGGLLMITSFGDDSKINNGKNSIIYALVGFAVALAAQTMVAIIVSHASVGVGGGASPYDNPIINTISIAIGIMLSVFNVVFFLIIIATGFRLVLAHGKTEETDTSKKMLIFAIVGAIIINLAKSIVGIVLNMGL